MKNLEVFLVLFLLFFLEASQAQSSFTMGAGINNQEAEIHAGVWVHNEHMPVFVMGEVSSSWKSFAEYPEQTSLQWEFEFGFITPNKNNIFSAGVKPYDRRWLLSLGYHRRIVGNLWAGVQLAPVRSEIGVRYFFHVTRPNYRSGCY